MTVTGTLIVRVMGVRVAGRTARWTVDSAAQLCFVVPPAPLSGPVEVVTPSGIGTSAASSTTLCTVIGASLLVGGLAGERCERCGGRVVAFRVRPEHSGRAPRSRLLAWDTMAATDLGTCPSCDARGPIGAPCAERVCHKRGYHFIPSAYAEKLAHVGRAQIDPLVGQVVGDYLAVDILGQGGFGKVYLARQLPILTLRAALKVMSSVHTDPRMAEALLKKFEGEAQALAALAHPNIVRLLKYGAHDGTPFLVMELVSDARTLKRDVHDLALGGYRLDAKVVRHIVRQVVNGLDAAHRLGIVHRDIKPDNIMLQRVAGDDHYVRILDFGLAKFIAEQTETSVAMGTPTYMAPEQVTRRNIGPWTDLYALGVITFELLTGRRPFAGRTQQELLANKLDANYDPTSRIADLNAPNQLLVFLRRALARHPADRFQSAAEYRQALDEVFEHLDAEAPELSQPIDVSQLVHELDADDETLADAIETGRADSASEPARGVPLKRESAPLSPAPQASESIALANRRARLWMLAAGALGVVLVAVIVALVLSRPNPQVGAPGAAQVAGPPEVAGVEPSVLDAAPVVATANPAPSEAAPTVEPKEAIPATATQQGAPADPVAITPDPHPEPAPPSPAADAPSAAPSAAPQDAPSTATALGPEAPAEPEPAAPAKPDRAPARTPQPVPAPAARKPAPAPHRLTVKVASSPAGADVLDGRKRLGKTPLDVSWMSDAAPPWLVLFMTDYHSVSVRLSTADAGHSRAVVLEPMPVEAIPPEPAKAGPPTAPVPPKTTAAKPTDEPAKTEPKTPVKFIE